MVDIEPVNNHDEENSNSSPPIPVNPPREYRNIDLFVVFLLILLPMLAIPFVLLICMLWSGFRLKFEDNGVHDLPVNFTSLSNHSYYTSIPPTKFALVSGLASHASIFATPFFMILFSYLVARDIAMNKGARAIHDVSAVRDLLRSLLKGGWKETWTWIRFWLRQRKAKELRKTTAPHVAAAGLLVTLFFTMLLIVAEIWTHSIVKSVLARWFENPYQPSNRTCLANGYCSQLDLWEIGGFITASACDQTLTQPILDPFMPSGFRPCSLSSTTNLMSLADPEWTYLVLQSGVAPLGSEFNSYSHILTDVAQQGTQSLVQVVTHSDNRTGLTHAFYFNQISTIEIDIPRNITGLEHKNFGVDYIASTTSMTTQCRPITQTCGLSNSTNSTGSSPSIPFNCSYMFFGDLIQPPVDGLEQFKGWDTSFYAMENGLPKNISVASPLNPFTFNVSAAVTSTTLDMLEVIDSPDVSNGNIVGVGNDYIAFAMSCEATIWDVSFAFINGSITAFNTTKADPRKASIVKAPLQVGFGRHYLFEMASLAVVSPFFSTRSLFEQMELVFSEIGIAIAYGGFIPDLSTTVRLRGDIAVTRVPEAPLFFLIVVCLLYAVLTTGIAITAVALKRVQEYSKAQVDLLPKEPISLKDIILKKFIPAACELAKPEEGWASIPLVTFEEDSLRRDLHLES